MCGGFKYKGSGINCAIRGGALAAPLNFPSACYAALYCRAAAGVEIKGSGDNIADCPWCGSAWLGETVNVPLGLLFGR